MIAALLGPGEVEMFPEGVEKGGPVVDFKLVRLPIDLQGDQAGRESVD
jgi:hypothetical protein